ncbi:MAG TPA: extracellular solute-binding protein [Firmicutes bacterium]|nr:extracellular solute-binding protein [Bacillota bacterium]
MGKKLSALFCAALLAFGFPGTPASGAEQAEPSAAVEPARGSTGYEEYRQASAAPPFDGEPIRLEGETLLAGEGEFTIAGEALEEIRIGEEQEVTWTVESDSDAQYQIWICCEAVPGGSGPVELEVLLDGESPFQEASQLVMERYYKNERDSIETDASQNDIRPTQVEAERLTARALRDSRGYFSEPFSFELRRGQNRLTLRVQREALRIRWIELRAPSVLPGYAQVKESYGDCPPGERNYRIQAEAAVCRSDAVLLPVPDRTSAVTEPYKGAKISLNMVGGESWGTAGQELVWNTGYIEQEGLYELRFRCKQNYSKAFFSNRLLQIDGETPFAEAEHLQFTYDSKWQIYTLRDAEGNPCLFRLTEGEHEISLTATLGGLGEVLGRAESVMRDLNRIYSEVLMITGSNPDANRDYSLDREIPETIAEMGDKADELEEIMEAVVETSGLTGSDLVALDRLARQLRGFVERPYDIPSRFQAFQNNIAALSTWIMDAAQRPLALDYIEIAAPGSPLPKADDGFWGSLWHEISMFLASFTQDYNAFSAGQEGAEQQENIRVWLATSRDYAQVLSNMIRTDFTPRFGVSVDLQIVTLDTVMPSVATGNGPDVWINTGVAEPINYAARKAAVDLTEFSDLDEVLERFYPSAVEPFRFEGGVYALPETQGFLMMFTRTDLLEELGLEKPQTWDDLIRMIPVLSQNNMGFLLDGKDSRTSPSDLGTNPVSAITLLCTLLYQNGGEVYQSDGAASALDSEAALQSFQELAKFYTNYGMPLSFDVTTRFRSGEAPVVIANYSLYNNLTVSAPEIRGLWEMDPIPGTLKPDGTIDRSVRSVSSGAMILSNSACREAGWEFLKWWTDAPTQTEYAKELESIMGPAARLQTANIEALAALSWSKRDFAALSEQIRWAKAMPEVPGGYYTSRHVENALRTVVLNGDDPRETMLDYVRLINEEIHVKRAEFGLSTNL